MARQSLGPAEVLGVKPFGKTMRQAAFAVFGDKHSPRTKADLSSLRQYKPRLATALWLGKTPHPRQVVITNLFNYRQPPVEDGWSVRVTDVEDFRGKQLTYDSHNATDFSIAPGYLVVAPAPGRVLRVSSEFHRGGLKVFIDHGQGLMTTSNHLGRSLVQVGQVVRRGEPVAISGYSGIDALLAFPFSPPHVHFNTWLNGQYVDPFARAGEVSLWRSPNEPRPAQGSELLDADYQDTQFDAQAVDRALAAMKDCPQKQEVLAFDELPQRATALMFYMNIYSWLFSERPSLYPQQYPRQARLNLPFSYEDFDGARFYDEL